MCQENTMRGNSKSKILKTMETDYVSCKKNTANKNSSVRRIKPNRLMLLSNCAICSKKKSRFMKIQELSSIQQF